MRLQFVIRNVEANKIDFYTYDAFEIRALCLPASSQQVLIRRDVVSAAGFAAVKFDEPRIPAAEMPANGIVC